MIVAEAEAYELALELCQELTQQHQRLTFKLSKLSELLTHQARLWEMIGQSSRQKPEYFRVVSISSDLSTSAETLTSTGLLWSWHLSQPG